MPKAKTKHKKYNPWEFWCYEFSPSVIIGERRIFWYDEKLLQKLQIQMRRKHIYLVVQSEEKIQGYKCKKQTVRVEVYMKVDKDLSFKEKVDEFMARISLFEPCLSEGPSNRLALASPAGCGDFKHQIR